MKAKATKQPKLTKLELKIKKLNAAYDKATPAQRRVMIAKDALAQLRLGNIRATPGTYVKLWSEAPDYDEPLQPLLLGDAGPMECSCCAKGAMFISCVRLSNRFNGPPTNLGSGDINKLVQWPENNYQDIEGAFELRTDEWGVLLKWVKKWKDKYPKAAKRLDAIFRNIIRNKGTFRKHDV